MITIVVTLYAVCNITASVRALKKTEETLKFNPSTMIIHCLILLMTLSINMYETFQTFFVDNNDEVLASLVLIPVGDLIV
jgi:hypothetical protein